MSVIGDALKRAEQQHTPVRSEASATSAATDTPTMRTRHAAATHATPGIAHRESWSASAERPNHTPMAIAGATLVAALAIAVGSTLVSSRVAHAPTPVIEPVVSNAGHVPPARARQESVPAASDAAHRPAPPQPAQPYQSPERIQPARSRASAHAPATDTHRSAAQFDLANRFRLDGVMLGGAVDMAVVNGTIVEVGQHIGGAVVRAIGKESVTLEVDGALATVSLRVHK